MNGLLALRWVPHALDRKLLRELARMWSQALTIALVVASGVGGFITSLSAVDSLVAARDRFYAEERFADVFATVKRAPDALEPRLRAIPGVADVQTTMEHLVRVRLEGVSDPIVGRLIGIDDREPPRMNRVVLRTGRFPELGESGARGDGRIEALVSAGFADVRGLEPGDTVRALVNGNERGLLIVGTALSPEYIFASLSGHPDMRGFGVFWVDRDTLAAAYDMDGAFTQVAAKLAPGASDRDVVARLTRALEPYGVGEAHGREDQVSHSILDGEIRQQQILGTVLPSIFLGVAAFLLNVVVSRLVSTQREQVAALKALGYADTSIAIHYLKLVLVIVAIGFGLGVWLGAALGAGFTRLYAEFFYFPILEHRIAPWLFVVSLGITMATAVAGTLNAIAATVRLPPAEAMRPPAPGHFRRTLLERLGLANIPPALRMVLRNMERRPWRTSLSIGGVAAAVAIVVMGNFVRDAMDHIVHTQFNLAMRSDVVLWMVEASNDRARFEIERLPGVIAVESGRDVPVRFVHGASSERGVIQGYAAQPELRRIIDTEGRNVRLPKGGLLMTDRLAAKLGLRVGERVRAQVLEGRRQSLDLTLVATVPEMIGLNAYMERRELNRLVQEGDVSSLFAVALERGSEEAFLEAVQELPRVVGTFSKDTLVRNMEEVSARNVRLMSTVLTLFASVIAVGVVYNNARIALAERLWELASLRVLGFTRAEVSALLLGEMAISIAVALPIGMLLGWGLVELVAELMKSDQFEFPVVIRARTYAWAAICVVAAGLASALVVRRRVDRLDMVAALKTRE